ncbi:MAG: c-type cytochrome [bacterium]
MIQIVRIVIVSVILSILLAGCRQDMHDQPRYEPLETNGFFLNNMASRPRVPGTVARGHLNLDEHFHTGKVDGEWVRTFPFPVTEDVLKRGRQRYDIFCAPCHDKSGTGRGMIVQRGFRAPPSFHIGRLRHEPVGHFFDVISNGFGAMYDYADRVAPKDRWAIVAYIRVLQLSRNAGIEDVPEEFRQQLLNE